MCDGKGFGLALYGRLCYSSSQKYVPIGPREHASPSVTVCIYENQYIVDLGDKESHKWDPMSWTRVCTEKHVLKGARLNGQ